jgi:cyclopropane fatty-acyl-phospholipid synthase-like methyltransferase
MPENRDFPALDFYTRFYDALPRSAAYSEFCRRVYGADLGQHGFSDMVQVDALLAALRLQPGEQALDLGCGDGRLTERIADQTAARVTGLDLLPNAIAAANARTAGRRDRVQFVAGDIGRLEDVFEPCSFDALISIDTLYFSDLIDTVRQMRALLRPAGRMAIFYSHGADPWRPVETFPRETLLAEAGPLANALRANGLAYKWWDFSAADYAHARRTKAAVEALRLTYASADDEFLCESRMGEAEGVMAAREAGCQARHLFLATPA